MRYAAHFLVASLLLSAVMAGFNWWVDPYAIYRETPAADVPMRVMSERIFKTVKLARMPADVVFIGTSRTDIGIGREQPALPGQRLANLATFGQPLQETRRLFELAVREGKPRTVVIGLDFFAFNALFAPPSDYVEDNYSPLRPVTLLLSISSLSDALKKYRQPAPTVADCCYPDGFRTGTDPGYMPRRYHHYFVESERMYLMEKYLPYPQCTFDYVQQGKAQSTLVDMHAILALAQREHIDLRLFISPSHARQWETIAASGLWERWEDWKRKLVEINEQEARQAGSAPFPLWDFSGYDEVSSEALPDDATQELMRGYTDSSHYVPAVGQRLVARLFGASDDWGVRLEQDHVETHLAEVRTARQRYRAGHARDVAEIEELAREAERAKHCENKR